ncbi:MAG: hypothetical protein AAFO07_34350 [Bacteroidota bacterium]
MDPLLKKLNYKDHDSITVLNAPDSFNSYLSTLPKDIKIYNTANEVEIIDFILIFVTKEEEVVNYLEEVTSKFEGDVVLWMCYPKKSSKKYKSSINRDSGWNVIGTYEMEGVRQVAIDEDWSALRFRKVAFIKTMKRKFKTLSKSGEEKAKLNKK